MERNQLILLVIKQILASIKPIQEPISKSFLQQSLETTKDISLKLFIACYKHPKIIIGATTLTLLLISLKKSSLLPITIHNLKKFEQKCAKKAQNQIRKFMENTAKSSQEASRQLTTSIDASQTQLFVLNDELEQNQQVLMQMPEEIAQSVALYNVQEEKNHDELFSHAHRQRTTQLNTLETHARNLMDNDEIIVTDFLKKFLTETTQLDNSLDFNIETIVNSLAQETALLHQTMHQNNHQENLQLTRLNSTVDNQHNNLAERVDSLIILLTGLVDTSEELVYEKTL